VQLKQQAGGADNRRPRDGSTPAKMPDLPAGATQGK